MRRKYQLAACGLIVPFAILTLAMTAVPASARSSVTGGELVEKTVTYDVRADIDGHSILSISGNSAKWHHLDFAAPGRLGGENEPTIINGAKWFPVWPHPGENRDCHCSSNTFKNVMPPLPSAAVLTFVQAVSCRDSCSVSYDDGTLVIDFNDDPSPSDAWYEVKVTLETGPSPILATADIGRLSSRTAAAVPAEPGSTRSPAGHSPDRCFHATILIPGPCKQ